jgi:hypothetical protein
MQCPHCGEATPDALSNCTHCGKTLLITADSVFTVRTASSGGGGEETEWGPKLARYVVGLLVLAAVLWFGANFLRGLPLAKNEVDEPPIEISETQIPDPKVPDQLPSAPLPEPQAIALPESLPTAKLAFGSRDPRFRQLFLERNGGDARTEAAVKLGLEWLAKLQKEDGAWDYVDYEVDAKYKAEAPAHRVGLAGLALLAYLGAGHTHKDDGPFKDNVEKLLLFILKQQNLQGQFPGTLYTQGICTMALAEAYGLTADTTLYEPTRRAIEAICAAQTESGGWDYGFRSDRNRGDTSVTGWQIMALKSAKKVGIEFPEQVYTKAVEFITGIAHDDGAIGYSNLDAWRSTPALTAAGLNALLFTGVEQADPRIQKAVGVLLANLPRTPKQQAQGWGPGADFYFWYHGSMALSRLGGPDWKIWNERAKEVLLALQDKQGDPAAGGQPGSWHLAGDPWSDRTGRLFVTTLALLALEVYYRYD